MRCGCAHGASCPQTAPCQIGWTEALRTSAQATENKVAKLASERLAELIDKEGVEGLLVPDPPEPEPEKEPEPERPPLVGLSDEDSDAEEPAWIAAAYQPRNQPRQPLPS